jgi:gp16 family phage-associated protein
MTPQQAKEKLSRQGKTITQWASEHGFDYGVAQRVLNGTNKGRSGAAHKVAVALGIKEGA